MTKVIVGMSGGVDSSVAALLLKQEGFDVTGVFMKNWEEDDTDDYCSATTDLIDVQAVCDQLDIPLQKVNFAAEYWDRVFNIFLEEYRIGRTPNPDILCNQEIKFKAFLDYAQQLGADFIATGHYARSIFHREQYQLRKGLDLQKDQSYFLYTLGQKQLKAALFPVGNLEKTAVRRLASEAKFSNHAKKDSTGICFIGERKFNIFLNRYLPVQPGPIETPAGKCIGQHQGLMYHTIGQRKGLGIGGRQDTEQEAWYVAAKDMKRNTLIVVQGPKHPLLFKSNLTCSQLSWVCGLPPTTPSTLKAKIRYQQVEQVCVISQQDAKTYQVQFEQPQRAVTPGQSIVFYEDDVCLGGGIIN